MTTYSHLRKILDTFIDLEKVSPFKVLFDVNCGLARWGFFLKLHLEVNKQVLAISPQQLSKLIGIYNNPDIELPATSNIYDDIVQTDLFDLISKWNHDEVADVILFLNEYSVPMDRERFEKILDKCRVGVMINLHENDFYSWMKVKPNGIIAKATELQFNKFEIVEVAENILFFHRHFKPQSPFYTYKTIDRNPGYIVLHTPNSVAEYEVPEGVTFIRINPLKHQWSGELYVYADEILLHTEVLTSHQSVNDYVLELKLTGISPKKLILKINHLDKRVGNEVWIRGVQFS
jgi:hypothetical protein